MTNIHRVIQKSKSLPMNTEYLVYRNTYTVVIGYTLFEGSRPHHKINSLFILGNRPYIVNKLCFLQESPHICSS